MKSNAVTLIRTQSALRANNFRTPLSEIGISTADIDVLVLMIQMSIIATAREAVTVALDDVTEMLDKVGK